MERIRSLFKKSKKVEKDLEATEESIDPVESVQEKIEQAISKLEPLQMTIEN